MRAGPGGPAPGACMDLVHWFVDFFLHLDKHLAEVIASYGGHIYALLFVIVFLETGLVVTPDPAGGLAALRRRHLRRELGSLERAGWSWLFITLSVAAVARGHRELRGSDSYLGPKVFHFPRIAVSSIRTTLKKTHAVLREARRQDHHHRALRADHPDLRAVCGRASGRMTYPTLHRLQRHRRRRLGRSSVVFGGYYFGNLPDREEQLHAWSSSRSW
ncbi:MAG: hypothetical protein MZW92_07550 [Comamonadaceae bacterium]|nr:hypothetical protein [Comamonadaceae bacterium]